MAQSDPKTEKIININAIISANLFDLAPDFVNHADIHDYWELVYVNSGTILSSTDERDAELTQGQIIFNRPNSYHTTSCNGKTGAVIFSMIFDCIEKEIESFDKMMLTVPTEAVQILKKLIDECNRTYNVSVYPLSKRHDAPFGGEQIIKNYLEAFLLLLMREKKDNLEPYDKKSKNLPETRKNPLSEEICEYLHDHLCEKVTLDMLSEHFHFGKVYLCDVFKKHMGVTIISYHTDLKISEAKRLLRETDSTVTEIADILGFESQSYFTRCFKNRTGYPPQNFRKMLITNAVAKRN